MRQPAGVFIIVLIILSILTGCNDVAVFINNQFGAKSFDGLERVEIGEDGHFELTWSAAAGNGQQPIYSVYMQKSKVPAQSLQSLKLSDDELLSWTAIEDKEAPRPSEGGQWIADVSGSTYVLESESIDPEMYYSFEVKAKSATSRNKDASKFLLTKVNFKDVPVTSVEISKQSLSLSWDHVLGATSYGIFDGAGAKEAIFSVTESSIALDFIQAAENRNYCIRAMRGALLSKSCMTIEGIGSSWKPKIIDVSTSMSEGLYKTGDILSFEVKFSNNVKVSSGAQLKLPFLLNTVSPRYALYSHGDGSDTLTFRYTIVAGDNSLGIALDTALVEGVLGSVYDAELRTALLDFKDLKVSLNKTIAIDTSVPTVLSVSSDKTNGYYGVGTVIPIKISFSEAVNVVQSAGVELSLNFGARRASYVSGSGYAELLFSYTIQPGDAASPMELASAQALLLTSGASIRDFAGNPVQNVLPIIGLSSLSGQKSLVIDTTAPTLPTAVSVTSRASAPTQFGMVWTGSTDSNFESHTAKLCASADCSTSCLAAQTLPGVAATFVGTQGQTYYGCVQALDRAGHLSAWAVSSGSLFVDDTVPTVVSVSSTKADGFYAAGTVIPITVQFSEPVIVTNPSDLALAITVNAATRSLSLTTGSGSDTLVFPYTVQAGDTETHLNYASIAALTLGSTGGIHDAAGNAAIGTLPALNHPNSLASQKNLVVDTTAPTAPASAGFAASASTSPSFAINWAASSDTNFKQYNAKLCAQNDCATSCLSEVAASASPHMLTSVADGTYYICAQGEDKAGQKSSWTSSASTLKVDATVPTVERVTSTAANGFYKAGAAIGVQVVFSEVVTVTNDSSLTLLLKAGPTNRTLSYISGSGSTTLLFNYTVLAGDAAADLDYVASNSLSLNGSATVKDAIGNNANLGLPTPGDALSLSGQKNLVLDTAVPTPTFVSPAALARGAGNVTISLSCDTGSTVTITGDLSSPLNNLSCVANAITRTVFFSAGEGNKTVTATETDQAGNVGTVSRIFVNDNIAPNLTQTTASTTTYTKTNSLAIGGACETGLDIIIRLAGAEEARLSCSMNAWTYNTANKSSDGARTYSITQVDSSGNIASASVTWIRDTIAPAFVFNDLSTSFTTSANANTYTFQGLCDSTSSVLNPSILITGPGITGSVSVSCTAGAWSYAAPVQTVDGPYVYALVQTDLAGNTSSIQGSWMRSTSGPVLTSPNVLIKSALNQATFSGACDSAFTISIAGPNTPVAPSCTSGAWTFTTPTITVDGNAVFTLSQTNGVSITTNLVLTFLRDVTGPALTAININDGATDTFAFSTLVDVSVSDASSNVTSICLLQKVWPGISTPPAAPSVPLAQDACWQSVASLGGSPSKTVAITDIPYNLALSTGTYSIYGYARDEIGNISALADNEGVDRASILLTLPVPPDMAVIDTTNASESTQSEFALGEEIDIHWSVTSGTSMAPNPISIRWSSNDSTWLPVASGLANAATSCTPVAGATGCYRMTSPSSSYMRLQVVAQNQNGYQYFIESKALNTGGRVRQVAGRTFKGLGGNARAFQLNYANMENLVELSPSNFVVTRQGVIYAVDVSLGVVKIDPVDQVVRTAFPIGTYPGDGPINNIKFGSPSKIWLDTRQPLQRLWVSDGWDIRVLDFNNNTIKSFNSTTSPGINGAWDTVEAYPTSAGFIVNTHFYGPGLDKYLPALVNETTGKLDVIRVGNAASQLSTYNVSENADCENFLYGGHPVLNSQGAFIQWWSQYTWIYAGCLGQHVYSVNTATLSGAYAGDIGGSGMPAMLPGALNNNWKNQNHWGLNNKLYKFNRQGGAQTGAYVYNQSADTWTKVLGQTNPASPVNQLSCVDGTLGSACDIDLYSIFVNEAGTIYFMDQGQVRMIDASGKVQTLFGTSFRRIANNLPATDTILGSFLNFFQRRVDGNGKEEVVYSHFSTKTYRSVFENKISVLAGNGLNWSGSVGAVASAPGIFDGYWTPSTNQPFGMDDAGNLYAGDYRGSGPAVLRWERSTSLWADFIPYTCSSCQGIATDIFDPTSGTFNSTTRVRFNSSALNAPSPSTAYGSNSNIKPVIHGVFNGKLLFGSAEQNRRFTGTTNGTYTNNNWYNQNVMLSSATISGFNGTTVLGFRRIMGAKGAALNSYNTDSILGWGSYRSLAASGTAANAFAVPMLGHSVPLPNVKSFQEFEGDHYVTFSAFNRNLLKVSANVVTHHAYTDQSMQYFSLMKSGTDHILYYCGGNGSLYKRNLTTPTVPAESAVPLVIPGAVCSGSTMTSYQRNGVDYLMFIYRQNGLDGILELKISP